jgi:hypothetical protein
MFSTIGTTTLAREPRASSIDRLTTAALALLLLLALPRAAHAQAPRAVQPSVRLAGSSASAPTAPMVRPFAVGERLEYDASYGMVSVGRGLMHVAGVESVRGRPTWRLVFQLKGGVPLYRIDDRLESWVDTASFTSLRFTKRLSEGRSRRNQSFEFDPAQGTYVEEGRDAQPTVAEPLDDGALFFYVRTLPLQVGQRYELNRYFKPDRNPVSVEVVRRERVTVPAGTFDAIVLRPVIKTSGMLSEARRTELWITDDASRLLVQIQSHLPFGTVTMRLRSITRPSASPAPVQRVVSAEGAR